jgi:hypothetical protein
MSACTSSIFLLLLLFIIAFELIMQSIVEALTPVKKTKQQQQRDGLPSC